MSFSLLPKHIAEDVTQLTPQLLRSLGIRLLMLDSDIAICVVSNSRKDRVKIFCDRYGIPCITHARKPFTKGINECLAKYQIPASEAALVGDQIFTDTFGANNAGVMPILVKAIHNHNIWLKLRHVAELPFIFAARKRRM